MIALMTSLRVVPIGSWRFLIGQKKALLSLFSLFFIIFVFREFLTMLTVIYLRVHLRIHSALVFLLYARLYGFDLTRSFLWFRSASGVIYLLIWRTARIITAIPDRFCESSKPFFSSNVWFLNFHGADPFWFLNLVVTYRAVSSLSIDDLRLGHAIWQLLIGKQN